MPDVQEFNEEIYFALGKTFVVWAKHSTLRVISFYLSVNAILPNLQ